MHTNHKHRHDGTGLQATSYEANTRVLAMQVAFDDLPFNASKSSSQKREYWEKSRRLQHGTLVALWWETPNADPAQPPTDPCITFAVISARDVEQLVPRREDDQRPRLGIRYLATSSGSCRLCWVPQWCLAGASRSCSLLCSHKRLQLESWRCYQALFQEFPRVSAHPVSLYRCSCVFGMS